MENLMSPANIKAVILSLLILTFTYWYYANQQLTFLSFGTAVLGWIVGIIVVLLCAGMVRLAGHLVVSEIIYPHLIFRFLQPFLVLLLLFWLGYGIFYIGSFGYSYQFTSLVKHFLRLHLPYIAGVSIILAIGLSWPFQLQKLNVNVLFYSNIKFALCVAGVFVVSVFLLYWTKLIKQPDLDTRFMLYQTLDNQFDLDGVEVKLLLDAGTQHHASEPYLLPEQNKLIINVLAESSNKNPPLRKSYKVDKDGKIIADLDMDTQFSATDGPFTFENGYIRSGNNRELTTWILDGNKSFRSANSLSAPNEWSIRILTPDQERLKTDHFYKTSKIQCANEDSVRWNGTRYYSVAYGSDTVRFKIDHVYSHNRGGEGCVEQRVEYFVCRGMNFDLIRLNGQIYYTLKQKVK
ncbi:hypothetical protein ACR79M_18475 [Sphingobacterium spiritivorum]|uniref:hypothetical protein n=1 Tax=Sphingobacterium spiritivorum TaxID=258 RepID=UPI003DA264C4